MPSILAMAKAFLNNDSIIDSAETDLLINAATDGKGITVKEHKALQAVYDDYMVAMNVKSSDRIEATIRTPIVVSDPSKLAALANATVALTSTAGTIAGSTFSSLNVTGAPAPTEHIAYVRRQQGNTITITLGLADIGFNLNSRSGVIPLGVLNGRKVLVEDTAGNVLLSV